jgi:hypothetical protein
MAKRGRGRPPKPKIEIEKNRVGRPSGTISNGALHDKVLMGLKWEQEKQNNPKMPKQRIYELVAEKFNATPDKVRKAITKYNELKKGGLTFEWLDNDTVMVIDDDEKKSIKTRIALGVDPFFDWDCYSKISPRETKVFSL